MATPWVILGRVLRVGFVRGDVVAEEQEAAQAEHAAAVYADAQADHDAAADAQAEHAAAVNADAQADHAVAADAQAEDAAAVNADAQADHAVAADADEQEDQAAAADGDAQGEHAAAAAEEEEEEQVEDVVAVDDDEEEEEEAEHVAAALAEEEAHEEDVVAVDDDDEEEEAQVEDVVAAVEEEEEDEEAEVVDVVAAVEEEEEGEEAEVVDVVAAEEKEEEEEAQVEDDVEAAVGEEEDEEAQVENVEAAVGDEEDEEAQVEDVVAAVGEEEEVQVEDVVAVGNNEEAQAEQVAAVVEEEEEEEAQVDDEAAVHAEEEEQEHEEHVAVEAAEEALAEGFVAVNDDDDEAQAENVVGADAQAEHAAAAAVPEPAFSFQVVLPPRVTVVAAGPGGHPDGENLDKYPYIIAAEPNFILVHFSNAPFRGTNFGDNPYPSHLVLLRHFQTADGMTTATPVRIPGRTGYTPTLWNIGSLGLYADHEGRYKIAEINVHKGSERARLISFSSVYHPSAAAEWHVQELEYPMAEENRDWVPHGSVTVDSTVWWFDLSWGILSCDVDEHELDLNFHYIPDGRALAKATPDIHSKRSITVSRNKLRYVEIVVTEGGGGAMVCMWTRMIGQDGWNWYVKYAVSFESIWDDDSYRETGLPRDVPVLAVVCPSNPALVYFVLEQRLFGVNVPAHRVMHIQASELVNIPDQPEQPPFGRYVVAWNLPPEVAQALGMDPFAGLHAGQLGAEGEEAIADGEGLQEGEIEDDEQPVAAIDGDDRPAEEIDFAGPQAAVVLEELRAAEIQTNEQQAEETDGNELLGLDEFSEEQMRRVDMMNLAVKMDPETLSRLKAEVKECFRDMDQPGPSQDPEDDAGGSAV